MKKVHRFILVAFCLSSFCAGAQDQKLISGNFTGYKFPRLVLDIESQTPYHIYYDSAETDSIEINLTANQLTLQQVFDIVFKNTNIHYALGTDNDVFVSKRYSIQTTLPKNFFDPGKAGTDSVVAASYADDAITPKTSLKISAENKLFDVGVKNGKSASGKPTVAGYIRDVKSGEPIMGATISVDTLSIIKSSDQFGYYTLTLPKGRHTIRVSSAGMKDTRRQVMVYSDGKLNIDLEEFIASLKAVIVSADKTSNTRNVEMGVSKLNIQSIKQVPVVFGEADVLKVILTLPGVTSVGEGSNGFNVRGGAADQNLILYNDATVYNPSHMFGFFSAFDPDLVKSVELYKSAIPEKYGGRLSSVLDVDVKDGNNKTWTGTAGISPLTGKFSIEGPLQKDKTSIIAGFRTTYSDWLLHQIPSSSYSNSTANFYDASVKISHIINAKNTLYLMGYMSSDKFNLGGDTTYAYANRNANLKWKHNFSNSSYAVFTTGIDHYQYDVSSDKNPLTAYKLNFDINQYYLRADFSYSPNNKHTISYGLNSVFYQLHPGTLSPDGPKSLVQTNTVHTEQALESAVFLGDQFNVSQKFSMSGGVRFTVYNFLGPNQVFEYIPGLPRESFTIKDTLNYGSGKIIKTYALPDIRFSARYSLDNTASIKFSFNTMSQYIHVISNTTNISPTDIWKLSDPNIKPQQGQQISLGFYKNFRQNSIETSIEVYYKKMQDYLDYKPGADLILNHHLETDVFETQGKAYGVELLIKKTTGKINGWISYTYSRTMLKQDDPLAGTLVNNGNYYPASFDKPNMVNFIGNYRFSHRYSLSLNVVYSTGRPITLPLAVADIGGAETLYYSDRNAYRIPDYFRTDISVNMDGNHKLNKKTHNSWSAGIYNVTGRQNAYSVYFVQQNGKVQGYQLSIFGSQIPFVTYTIKF
jgi:hypothetical protein